MAELQEIRCGSRETRYKENLNKWAQQMLTASSFGFSTRYDPTLRVLQVYNVFPTADSNVIENSFSVF